MLCSFKTGERSRSILDLLFLAHLSSAQGELLGYLNVRRPSSCVVRRASCVVRCPSSTFDVVYTLASTFLIQSFSNLVRMFVSMMWWTLLKMGVVGSKSRSLGQILEKPCLHSRGHNFCPIFLKLGQNVCFDHVMNPIENGCGRIKK